MTRVVAPSRLHFGLLHVPAEGVTHWPDGLPVRRFGGVGLMIQQPAVIVRVEPAAEWSAEGPSADRALEFARRVITAQEPRFKITVEECPAQHVGLGVGTQLGLAVAKAITQEMGLELTAAELATTVGRGERSAIGVTGFATGGLIVDGGKLPSAGIGTPLISQHFPGNWRILLARPTTATRWHGAREREAFARPRSTDEVMRTTEQMCRVLLLGLLPAAVMQDIDNFGDALYEYNQLAGQAFAPDQGGTYAGPEVTELVAMIRSLGVRGVGQSSWGPTVFAVCRDEDEARRIEAELRGQSGSLDVSVTAANNTGAKVALRQ